MSEHKEPIPSRIYNASEGGHLAGTEDIFDDIKNKSQKQINTELEQTIGELKQTIGEGGNINERINQAKNDVIGGASADYNTLKKEENKIKEEVSRAQEIEGGLDRRIDTLENAVGTGGSVDSRISAAVAIETTRAQEAESNLNSRKANKATTLTGYGITDAYTKSETYSKEEINDHMDTPNQGYITAVADSNTTTANLKTLIDTAAGSDKEKADFIYRVGCWDGSQYNDTMYSEYVWIDNAYLFLSKKSQVDEVFDISAYHANTKYADLAAALNGGVNIPQSLQKGGMSVKFVQSSDNKYIQYRLMSDEWSTTVADWQGVDDEPTPGSDNLVKSGGVAEYYGVHRNDNDYVEVKKSKTNQLIETLRKDGTKEFYGDVEAKQKVRIIKSLQVDENIKVLKTFNVDDITFSVVSNKSWAFAVIDEDNKIGIGLTSKGKFYADYGNIDKYIPAILADVFGIFETNNTISIVKDVNGKIASYRSKDAILHENAGINTPMVITDWLNLSQAGVMRLKALLGNVGGKNTIVVGTFNVGDFTGTGLTPPSEEGKMVYRKCIGSLGCDILNTQEDVTMWGDYVVYEGSTSRYVYGDNRENPETAIFGMFKNYYRGGGSVPNYKAFASNEVVANIAEVRYTNSQDTNYSFRHYYFLKGETIIAGKTVLLICVHLDWSDIATRREQIRQIISYADSYDYVIVSGDLNHDPYVNGEYDPSINIETMRREELDMFVDAGYSLANGGYFGDFDTYTSGGQTSKLDNVIVKGGVINNVEVKREDWMNDHFPLCATISF